MVFPPLRFIVVGLCNVTVFRRVNNSGARWGVSAGAARRREGSIKKENRVVEELSTRLLFRCTDCSYGWALLRRSWRSLTGRWQPVTAKGARHESLNGCWRLAPGPSPGPTSPPSTPRTCKDGNVDSFHQQPCRAVGPSDEQDALSTRPGTDGTVVGIGRCGRSWPATGRRYSNVQRKVFFDRFQGPIWQGSQGARGIAHPNFVCCARSLVTV